MIKSMMLVCAFALAACGGGKKADTTPTTTTDPNTSTSNTDPNANAATPTGDGQPCTQEIAMVCPEGQVDSCLKTPAEGEVHKCVAK